jgi:hypothetical protein
MAAREQSHGTDEHGRWALDRTGRKIRVGDRIEVPHEGEKVITGLAARDKNGLPIVEFACEDPRGIGGLFGWEYTDAVKLLGGDPKQGQREVAERIRRLLG